MTRILVVLLFLSWGVDTSAQTTISDLSAEVESRRVQLESMAGNGGSSGTVISGYLVNEATTQIRIDVNLSRPLFLVNRGSSQNMVVTGVYLSGGQYSTDGRKSFITLRPKSRTAVTFVAYCADFDKDNPSERDRFAVGSIPPVLEPVMANIRAYAIANPNADITVAAQAAVWLVQGKRISEIRTRFPVTSAEERLARSFIR
jgi:hypothetical protein